MALRGQEPRWEVPAFVRAQQAYKDGKVRLCRWHACCIMCCVLSEGSSLCCPEVPGAQLRARFGSVDWAGMSLILFW